MKNERSENLQQVDRAFSAQAPLFDAIQNNNPILEWMRSRVHRHMNALLCPDDTIVDINAGTGIDALHFARLGHRVHAMDIARGMVSRIRSKISEQRMDHLITAEQRSFEDLAGLAPQKFHHAFSNFGGLNCIPDLRPVARQIPEILHPGGLVTLVIMPPICPWEIAAIFKGNTTVALRRLKKNGVRAHIEGEYFTTYYHSAGSVIRTFGERFAVESIRSVAFFTPPPSVVRFPSSVPRFTRLLQRCDELFSAIPPIDRCGDQYILTLRFLR